MEEIRKIIREVLSEGSKTITVYHGTHSKKADSISKEGLKAGNKGYGDAGWYVVATDFESALFHATPEGESEAIVFEFEVPITNEKWEGYPYFWPPYDRDNGSKWFALKQPLPASMIKKVHRIGYDQFVDQKSKGLNEEVIEETFTGQKELEDLTNKILHFISERFYSEYENSKIYYGEEGKRVDTIPMVTTGKMTGEEYEEIGDFVRETSIRVIPTTYVGGGGVQGYLNYLSAEENRGREKFEIRIKYSNEDLEKINEEFNDARFGEPSEKTAYFKMYYMFYSTLLHELQHAYDAWRSKGKAFAGQLTQKYIDQQSKVRNLEKKSASELTPEERQAMSDGYKAYLNLVHEINARFTQALHRVHLKTVDSDWNEIMNPWDKVFREFKYEFHGWRSLSEKMQKKLARRLAKAYYDQKAILKTAVQKYGEKEAKEMIGLGENVQQAEKLYFRDGKLPEEVKQGILKVTGGDQFTKLVADLIYHFSKFGNLTGYELTAKNFYDLLKNYNKDVFPVKGVDVHKYGIDGDLHVLDLLGQLQNRERAVYHLKRLPSIAIRNLKSLIKTPMEHEYSLNDIKDDLSILASSIERLPSDDELRAGLMNKIFASRNTLEDMAKIASKYADAYNRHGEEFDQGHVIENLDYINADLIQHSGNIIVIRANDQEAIQTLGCTSQWCFSTYGDEGYWQQYAPDGFVYVIFDFNKDPYDAAFLLTFLPETRQVFVSTNVGIQDLDSSVEDEEYLESIGVDMDALENDISKAMGQQKMVAEIRSIIREALMKSDEKAFDLRYFQSRIPFLKDYDVEYAPGINEYPRMPDRVQLKKIVDEVNVTIPAGDNLYKFPRVTAISEFTFYPHVINDNTFYVLSINNKLVPWQAEGMSDLTYRILMSANNMVSEKLSEVIEIVVPEGEEIPDGELNAAINTINKKMFEFEQHANNWQVDLF